MLKIATKFAPDEATLSLAWRAGFRYGEFFLTPEILAKVNAIVKTAQNYPIEYVPHFPNKKVTKNTAQACVDLYKRLDCKAMVIHQPMLDQWGASIQEWHPDICFAVENHYLTEEQFWEWADKNPGLNLDIEHLWKFTLQDAPLPQVVEFFSKFLDRHADKLNHIHLPGYIPGADEHRPMYCSRELMYAVWPLLEKKQYTGLIVSEINKQYQTFQDLRMDALLFEGWHSQQKSK